MSKGPAISDVYKASLISISVILSACTGTVHTLESTKNMTRNELAALCTDLKMRADQDCLWNMEQRQSTIQNRQTWEINCRARRDSARESFDNVCHPARFRSPEVKREDN